MKYSEWLQNNWDKDNVCPPKLDAQQALNILQQYLLGDNWYIVDPLCNEQANVEVVHEILYKHSKQYRKEIKQQKRGNK